MQDMRQLRRSHVHPFPHYLARLLSRKVILRRPPCGLRSARLFFNGDYMADLIALAVLVLVAYAAYAYIEDQHRR